MQQPFDIIEITDGRRADHLIRSSYEFLRVAYDTETTGDRPRLGKEDPGLRWALGDHAFMATWAYDEHTSYACYDPELTGYILDGLTEDGTGLVMQNGRFDLQLTRAWNGWIPKCGYRNLQSEDTLFGFRTACPGESAKLKEASKRFIAADYMDVDGPEKAVKSWLAREKQNHRTLVGGKWVKDDTPITYAQVPKELMLPYAAQDVILTIISQRELEKLRIADPSQVATYQRELRLIPLIINIERSGLPIDVDRLAEKLGEAREHVSAALERFGVMAPGVSTTSNPQMVKYLYTTLGEPVRHLTDGNNPATNEAALLSLNNHEVRDVLIEARHWTKAYQKYNEFHNYNRGGYLHSDLKSDGARTGRFSSQAPQLHNTARPDDAKPWTMARSIIRPRAGTSLVFVDWDSVEMRLFCSYSKDAELIKVFAEDRKVHRYVASKIYGIPEDDVSSQQYSFGKTLGFCILYGGGLNKITESLLYGAAASDPLTREEALHALRTFTSVITKQEFENPFPALANQLWNAYHSSFPTVKKFTRKASDRAKQRGYIINGFGRKIAIPAERAYIAANAVIQGTAADMMKEGMLRVEDDLIAWCAEKSWKMWEDVQLNFSIHDELIATVPEGYEREYAQIVTPSLTTWPQFSVPMKVDFSVVRCGGDWAHKEHLDV